MKTILFPIFQGVTARNILRAGVIDRLLQDESNRVVFLVNSLEKKQYLEREFGTSRIIYESAPKYVSPSLQGLFEFLKFNLLDTKRMDMRRRIYLAESGNYLGYWFKLGFNRIFARPKFRELIRSMDLLIVRDRNYQEVFDKYRPDLVISAHIFSDQETSLVRQAHKRGVKTVAIINSWDKLTSRHIIRVLPDIMIVHNDIVRLEAIKHADMDPSRIMVTGVPHYDDFINEKARSKDILYSKLKIDPNKRILLFCPTGQYYSDQDAEIINTLVSLQIKGAIPADLQIVVRFPPNDTVDISRVAHQEKVVFYQPGIRFSSKRGVDWDMNEEDIRLLHDMLRCSEVVICPPSSMSVDAAILDRPVINICFGERARYATDNINLYYESDHYVNILKYNGIRLVTTEDELAAAISDYLAHPDRDKAGRRKIAEEQAWRLDGRSSERMADALRMALSPATDFA